MNYFGEGTTTLPKEIEDIMMCSYAAQLHDLLDIPFYKGDKTFSFYIYN